MPKPPRAPRVTRPLTPILPPLPTPEDAAAGYRPDALPYFVGAARDARALATGEIQWIDPTPENDTPPELLIAQPVGLFFYAVYIRGLAHRYITDTGAVGIEDGPWDRDKDGAIPPPSPREQLTNADGAPVATWREWLAERMAAGETHDSGDLFDGLHATRVELLKARLATVQHELALERAKTEHLTKRRGHRLGSHAVRSLTRSYEERSKAALKAFRNNKLTKAERDLFISDDATSLKGDELLVAALLLEYARQEGQLRDLPAANYRFGPLVLDIAFFVSKVSVEEMARDLGGAIDEAGRVDKTFRDTVAAALESLQTPRLVLVEPRVIMSDEDASGKKRRVKGDAYIETAPLLTETTDPDGERAWKVHPALALGYHRAAVYIDRAAWKRGQAHVGARYLDDAFTRADVYFRMLAPAAQKERQDNGDELNPETGVSKKLRTTTLLDRFGIQDTVGRGQTHVAKRLEKLLGFCIGAGSVLAWERWEGAPRRKGGAPELKGYTVRLPIPAAEEPEPTLPLFPELEAALLALGEGQGRPS